MILSEKQKTGTGTALYSEIWRIRKTGKRSRVEKIVWNFKG